MATYTKTLQTALFALQSVALSTVVKATALDVSTFLAAFLYVRFGRRAATAAGAGVNIRIEGSPETSGDRDWLPLAILTTQFAAVSDEAITGTNNAGQNVITVASATGFVAGDVIFIDNTTIGNSEWHRIKLVSGGNITLEDNLTNAQNSGAATIYDAAEIFTVIQAPLDGVKRLRAVADGSLFTQAFAIEIKLVTVDSIG